MSNKPQTDKQRAHMLFKMWKAGMPVSPGEIIAIKKYYPFMRASMEVR